MHSFYHPERRKNRRIKIDFPAICRVKMPPYWVRIFDERAFEISTVDISEGGISIISEEYCPLRSRLSLEFISSDLDLEEDTRLPKHVDFNGRVVYASLLKDQNQYRLGISFNTLTEENQEKFFELVCTPHIHPRNHRENAYNSPKRVFGPYLNRLICLFHSFLAKGLLK